MRFASNLSGLSINNIKSKIKAVIVNYDSKLNQILRSEKNGAGFTDEYVPQQVVWLSKFFIVTGGFQNGYPQLSHLVSQCRLRKNRDGDINVTK